MEVISEIKKVLPLLGVKEITNTDLEERLGLDPGYIKHNLEKIVQEIPALALSSSVARWGRLHQDEVVEMGRSCKSLEEFQKKFRAKHGYALSGEPIERVLEGSGWHAGYGRSRFIYHDYSLDRDKLSYLTGYFLGDGGYHSRFASWWTTKPEYLSRFADDLCMEFRRYRDGYFNQLICVDPKLGEFYQRLGIPDRKTYSDFTLKDVSQFNLVELFAGWVDADGWKRERECCYMITNSSESLVSQMVGLLGSHGKRLSDKQERRCLMKNFRFSKPLSLAISLKSKFLMKRLDLDLTLKEMWKIRKKSDQTKRVIRMIQDNEEFSFSSELGWDLV